MVDYRHPRRGTPVPPPGIAYVHPRRSRPAPAAPPGRGWALRTCPDGSPQRFAPDRPITVTANVDQAGRWALDDLEEAVGRLAAATGLAFRFAGLTALLPQSRLHEHVDPQAPSLHVAWAKPGPVAGGSDLLPPEEPLATGALSLTVGVACPWVTAVPVPGGRAYAIVRSTVVLDSTVRELYRPGFVEGGSRGLVLLHELGHAVGLDHVDDPRQLMHPVALGQPARYGEGDLAGLRRLGVEGGPLPLLP